MNMYELLYQYFKEKTNIDRDRFNEFSDYFKPSQTSNKEFLLRIGKVCKFNYFVNKGCLRIFSLNEAGDEMTRYFTFEGKFGTALSSFIEQKPSFEFIQSVEKSDILMISRKDFYMLVDAFPEVNIIYRDILEMAYVTSQKRIYGLQGHTALERLKWLIAYQPKILSKLSNKVIASYLGVTPYTLSRLKSQL
ncbi:Crp/Fnr family transcriptional regulator [Flexithrix dorotheae]|uniref:Crp/Fnr family transcriptional regulator n=1 Tax=Flexithrix dorotheae TaxID=70993 RepID=UPI00037BDBCD|nr:Crp/Fnr family transcriptional regulator [Flexithrix dorotheae]